MGPAGTPGGAFFCPQEYSRLAGIGSTLALEYSRLTGGVLPLKTSVTLSDELLDRLKVRAGESASSVSALLASGAEMVLAPCGAGSGDLSAATTRAEVAERQVIDMTATIAKLEKDVAFWRRLPQPKPAVSAPLRTQEKIDPKVHHPTGPVLASAVPSSVSGEVGWSALKGPKK